MTYLIRRTRDGKYATRTDCLHGYTNELHEAARYSTRAEAEADCVNGETVMQIPVAHCGPALESFIDPAGALQKAGLLIVDR